MRKILTLPLLLLAAPAYAAEPAEGTSLMSANTGVMFWVLVIFITLWIVLARYAFKPITAAVEAREAALREAIEAAKRDRDEAALLLLQHRAKIEEARADAQRFIAEARTAGEKVRAHMLEETKAEQQEMLERARREIEAERDRAIAQLRREAVELAISGAEKVIERNLDSDANRKIVETFLASIPASKPDRASR
ncbi:MAG: F0F1 ATP synthase subunit B [Gemmatimonadaceae bacterium]